MTKPFAASEVRLSGPSLKSGPAKPYVGAGTSGQEGSLYICTTDCSWWHKVDSDNPLSWVQVDMSHGNSADSEIILAGMPVYSSVDGLKRANAAGSGTANVVGLSADTAAPTLVVHLMSNGPLYQETSTWDALTGQIGGLTPGAVYYLGLSPGALTTTPPSAAGQVLAQIGRALDTTTLIIAIPNAIFL